MALILRDYNGNERESQANTLLSIMKDLEKADMELVMEIAEIRFKKK